MTVICVILTFIIFSIIGLIVNSASKKHKKDDKTKKNVSLHDS